MILTDSQIIDFVNTGAIKIDPFDKKQVQPASIDIRVGKQGATTTTKKIIDIQDEGYILVDPGDFAIIISLEKLELGPQYTGRFGLRSKYARKGLIATTGPQIDPGFRGRLIIGITNLTPKAVSLPYKDDLLTVEFHKLEQPAKKPYNGPYQDKDELGPEEIEFITESDGMALSEVLTTLRSLSQNVGTLSKDVHDMTSEFRAYKWVIPVIIAVGMAIIGFIEVFH